MQQREALEALGNQILAEARTELYLSMRFLGPALDALPPRMDLRTRAVGTDAASIRFHPHYLTELFLSHPRRLLRTYLHMIMHCLFRHFLRGGDDTDPALFDIAADIAAESLVDGLRIEAIEEVPTDFRTSWYRTLSGEISVLTAEKIYQYFTEHPLSFEEQEALKKEFCLDDHSFWDDLKPDDPPSSPQSPSASQQRREEWENKAKETRDLMALPGHEASDEHGGLSWMLSFMDPAKTDYRNFLHRFATVREEVRVDPDSFDYAYYHFGLEHYGNMPLIEENEYRESIGIDELVIAIDTSGSTKPHLVEPFLQETAAILSAGETFLHHVQIHLIECDNEVRRDRLITNVQELGQSAGQLTVSGGMGTDFRPVFEYVKELQRKGELTHLRGLLYFTDGYGTYPQEATPYDTAFIFRSDADYDDSGVPDWALKLYAGESASLKRGETT